MQFMVDGYAPRYFKNRLLKLHTNNVDLVNENGEVIARFGKKSKDWVSIWYEKNCYYAAREHIWFNRATADVLIEWVEYFYRDKLCGGWLSIADKPEKLLR